MGATGEKTGPKVLVDGIVFPESPRWHDGQVWFVDMFGKTVMRADAAGHVEVLAQVEELPSGLGFLPDGTAVVVQMRALTLIRVSDGGVHADLNDLGGAFLNDMVMDAHGRAYVGLSRDATLGGDAIVRVDPDGSYTVVATDGVHDPNGSAITPDGRTLIVGMGWSSPVHELIAYDIAEDGNLSNRRVYADVGQNLIDGACLDEEGRMWISTLSNRFVRVAPGGAEEGVVELDAGKWAVACMLGGPTRHTLFMATIIPPAGLTVSEMGLHQDMSTCQGFIETVQVEHAGAGLP